MQETELSTDQKSMLNYLMFLVENINVVPYNLISNFHKDSIFSIVLVKMLNKLNNRNKNKNKIIKRSNKRNQSKVSKKEKLKKLLNNKNKKAERKDKNQKLLQRKERD